MSILEGKILGVLLEEKKRCIVSAFQQKKEDWEAFHFVCLQYLAFPTNVFIILSIDAMPTDLFYSLSPVDRNEY